jgi:nucleotide-binding universal stress UspA family protein
MPPKKILFCTDFSVNSEPARKLAIDYASAFGGQLLILHVIDHKEFPGYVDWAERMRELLDEVQRTAEERLQAMAKECSQLVKNVKTYCRIGVISNEVVALAAKESVDLIVVGTHGRTGVKNLIMGSVARRVLATARRPILIVHGPEGKGESND